MNQQSIGNTIARLRRSREMTQQDLAKHLNVSNKTVSKWENGQGYPDITLFPLIASLFGVTIDYLMLGEKRGIAIAGNMIADIVKSIDCYPEKGMLANISEISRSVGGCVPNTAIDLARIDRSVPISAIGRVGKDENGRYIVSQLYQNGINVDQVSFSERVTSFCDVMSMPTGERTFFHKKGANAEFSPADVDISALNCDILHIGYISLLDRFDSADPEYGTVMARFLNEVQQTGIRTSIDVVSDSAAELGQRILPALKYCDYAIMNEIESASIWGLAPRSENGELLLDHICETMRRMAASGVRQKVVIHAKEAAFILDVASDTVTSLGSLEIPDEDIKGNVGAGDAFCAGCLYGFYNGYSDIDVLEFASGAAACSLFAANSVDGMRMKNEIIKINQAYERKK